MKREELSLDGLQAFSRPRTARETGSAGGRLGAVGLLAFGLSLALSGCASSGGAASRDSADSAAFVSPRDAEEGLSPWERDRQDQMRRLNEDRRRVSTGEK